MPEILRLTAVLQDRRLARSSERKQLNCDEIAELPDDCIKQMTRDELISVIRSNHRQLPSEISEARLRVLDRRCLIRLAFLSRRCSCSHDRKSDELHSISRQGCCCPWSGLDARP